MALGDLSHRMSTECSYSSACLRLAAVSATLWVAGIGGRGRLSTSRRLVRTMASQRLTLLRAQLALAQTNLTTYD
jgi:hypothetical protein